jgi:hypothetical protein
VYKKKVEYIKKFKERVEINLKFFRIYDNFLGINFNKDFGQHILKNPLIITSMVEKVIFGL